MRRQGSSYYPQWWELVVAFGAFVFLLVLSWYTSYLVITDSISLRHPSVLDGVAVMSFLGSFVILFMFAEMLKRKLKRRLP
jgi:hypothetical protein